MCGKEMDTINVSVDLQSDFAKKFLFIKEKLGLTLNSEVIRAIIVSEYDRLKKQPKLEVPNQ